MCDMLFSMFSVFYIFHEEEIGVYISVLFLRVLQTPEMDGGPQEDLNEYLVDGCSIRAFGLISDSKRNTWQVHRPR